VNLAVSKREESSRGFTVYDRKFDINVGWAAYEECSATWNLDTNQALARTEENLAET
jgi:hypothetical protein